ncbi:MAG: hypothetical protein J07AB43_14300 [Candidatus Nanosalina sp. J07AB43]|nr:MAG: hypothetical protein J07AB43_14300 [Candidatus Nanosalina sp. J07AB43]
MYCGRGYDSGQEILSILRDEMDSIILEWHHVKVKNFNLDTGSVWTPCLTTPQIPLKALQPTPYIFYSVKQSFNFIGI